MKADYFHHPPTLDYENESQRASVCYTKLQM